MAVQIRFGLFVCLILAALALTSATAQVASLQFGETCQLTPSPTPTATAATVATTTPPPPGPATATTRPPAPVPTTPATSVAMPNKRNATDPCNSEAWLQCDGQTQKCACQPGMILAKDRKSCVSKIGQPCQTVESDPSRPLRFCIEDHASCVMPDDANKTSVCKCDEGFLPIPGSLACRRGPGAACDRTEDCNTNALLSCQNGVCQCDRQSFASWEQTWDPIQAKCLSMVGGVCNEQENAFIKRPCIKNAVCNNDTMKCECKNATFKETTDKRCLLNYDQPCTSANGDPNKECHPYYECVEQNSTDVKKCGCNSNTTDFDQKFQICAIRAGKSCGDGNRNGNAFCVERAVCSERYKECKCEPGFIQTKDGFCTGGYRADCNLESDKCDKEMNLECEEQKCECMPGYSYSSDSRKCVGYAGTKCKANSDCNELAECVSNATATDKNCRCKIGWSPTPDGRCMVAFGKYCFAPNQCNEYDFLHCDDIVDKKCKCENDTTMMYSPTAGKCVSLVGAHCTRNTTTAGAAATVSDVTNLNRTLDCVGNTTCAKIETSVDPDDSNPGVCTCNEGFSSIGGVCIKMAVNSSPRLGQGAGGAQQLWILTSTMVAVSVTGFWQT